MFFTSPDSGENRAFDGAIQEIGRKNMGYMFRIFDLKEYFRQQTHCERPVSRDFILQLQIEDDFMQDNNTGILLQIQGEQVRLVEEGRPHVALRAGIADFSSFVMGAIPLKDFLWAGRMQCSDASYRQDIQNALGWSQKPKNYTYF